VERALQQPPLVAPAAPTAPIAPTAVAHTTMRRVIAQRLSEAKRNVPHFYLSVEVDVDAVLALREQLQAQAGIKPSVNDFVVKAVALAMKRLPAVNASWGEEAMLRHERVDVSVAVATPGGLVTPIVRDADTKSLAAIQAEVKALAARARDGRLKAEEYQGGGFTISNLGMYGVREFFAIVNPPQAAILAVGACEQRPVVRDGVLAVGMRMTCSLSADHRVIDGALGAEFLAAVRGLLEAPLALLV
jgi:pyruvate dehydrogenase E2 component (dihydrolipoamide acetyltransferase)